MFGKKVNRFMYKFDSTIKTNTIMAKKSSSKTTRYRSAETGHYVTKAKAQANPKTTVKETDKKKGKK
jgi:hypothetical protein